ncbi:MAG: class I SAM-dependent methyltransferase [Myxococcales bacterium]|nr:class I SAM-dependent methyltransferase [Myxococcales bacterium]
MADLFEEKAKDWEARPAVSRIAKGVGNALLERVRLSPQMRVIDFGAGTGLICGQVAPHVEKVYAVDVSQAMLDGLTAKPALHDKVEAICRDILEQPLDLEVDLIVSAMALHHVEDIRALMQAFARHLSSTGRLALADLDSEDGSFHPPDVQGVFHHGFDRSQLQAILEQTGFRDVQFVTAVELDKEGKTYPIFLVTASKA